MQTVEVPVWDPLHQRTLSIGSSLHTVSFHLLPHLGQPDLSPTTTDIHMLNSVDTLYLLETPATSAHPTTSFFLICLPWHHSLPITSHHLLPFRLLFLRCSYWYFAGSSSTHSRFHSSLEPSLLPALLNSHPSWDASSVPGASIAMPIVLVDSSAMHLSSSTASVYPDSWG